MGTHEVVTVWYRPLEILLGATLYSVPVDLWSIGAVMGEMATGQPLFAGDSEIDTIFKIFQKLGTPTDTMWPARGWTNIKNTAAQIGTDGIDLLERLMCYDPRKRLSARRAVQHAYFRDVEQATADSV